MKKRIIFYSTTLVCAIFIYLIVCIVSLPQEISLIEGEEFSFSNPAIAVLNVNGEPVTGNINLEVSDNITAQMTLKNLGIPVKNVVLDILPNTEVVPWGATVGVRIDTDGLLVLGTGIVTDPKGVPHNPADGILKSGDLIVSANGQNLNARGDLIKIVEKSDEIIKLKIKRDDKLIDVEIKPIVSMDSNKKKLGVWVRDSTQGIGTITYYNPTTNNFAALGHGIMDIDTKQLMQIRDGIIMPASIASVKKGKKGAPGELVGTMNENQLVGHVKINSPQGIYGSIESGDSLPKETMKIALQDKVHEGPARIRSNVSQTEIKEYDVYIESVNRYSSDSTRGMVIRITDPELLSQTGGIVQGMSGSPILQENALVGAVTHVFVQDPTKGYGIFIENMLKREKNI